MLVTTECSQVRNPDYLPCDKWESRRCHLKSKEKKVSAHDEVDLKKKCITVLS